MADWYVNKSGNVCGNAPVPDGYEDIIALVFGDDRERIARLIAAAPEMAEALKEARAALHQHYVDWDGEPEDAVPLQLARAKCDAILSKALGDQQ